MRMKKEWWTFDRIAGAVSAAFGIWVCLESFRVYSYAISPIQGDHVIPGVVGVLFILLGLRLLFGKQGKVVKVSYPPTKMLLRILGTFVIILLYVYAMDYLGYALSTAIASFLLFLVFGGFSWKKSLICAAIATAVLWAMFILWLDMPFPKGFFQYL